MFTAPEKNPDERVHIHMISDAIQLKERARINNLGRDFITTMFGEIMRYQELKRGLKEDNVLNSIISEILFRYEQRALNLTTEEGYCQMTDEYAQEMVGIRFEMELMNARLEASKKITQEAEQVVFEEVLTEEDTAGVDVIPEHMYVEG